MKATAKVIVKKGGRKPLFYYNKDYLNEVKELYEAGIKPVEIAKRLSVSVPTVYRWLKELGLFKSKRINYSAIALQLELNGFAKVKPSIARRLAAEDKSLEIVRINLGVGMEGRKYSAISFFGTRPYTLTFVVKDVPAFKEHALNLLKGLFYEQNPNPDAGLRKAFTHFIHAYGLEP